MVPMLAACVALGPLTRVLLILVRLLIPVRLLSPGEVPIDPPRVLIQLSLFKEGALVEGLLESISVFDWPRERLQIQVMDDSTDASLARRGRSAPARVKRRVRSWGRCS